MVLHLIQNGITNAIKRMKNKLIILSLLLFFVHTATAQNKIMYNGLYHTMSDSLNPFRFYLRFYADSTVIGYGTGGNPQNLLKWFSKDHASAAKGKYVLNNAEISFALKSDEGIVNHQGVLLPGNKLLLTVKSLINKFEAKEEYIFWQLDKLK